MNQNDLALARPRHILDLYAHGAHVLAAVGHAAMHAAKKLDEAAQARDRGQVDRAGPRWVDIDRHAELERHGVVDSWRVR